MSLIENKSLNKFSIFISTGKEYWNNWESEDSVNLIMSIINLIPEFAEQYEIDIAGKKIQVIELSHWINLFEKSIFGENKWIVCSKIARFTRLLKEYTQIWKELGVRDLDLRIINEIKSPKDINKIIGTLDKIRAKYSNLLEFYLNYSVQRHDCITILSFAYWHSLDIDNSLSKTKELSEMYPKIKPLLKKMRNLKTIEFRYFHKIHEAIAQLGLKELQQNGVKILSNSSNSHRNCNNNKIFTITADEFAVLHTNEKIDAINIKAKGDFEVSVYGWNLNYIVDKDYLFWAWYDLYNCEIDWEFIKSKKKISLPKFAGKLKDSNNHNLILIPLNRIKKVSYIVYYFWKQDALKTL